MDHSLSTSSSRKQKIVYAVLFLALVLLLDLLAGTFLKKLHKKLDRGEFGLINKIINGPEEKVLVFGSSRAKYHYNSKEIESNSKMTCYNAGFNGRGILLSNILIKLLLQKSKPSVIILDINFLDKTYAEEHRKLDIMKPLYSQFNEVKELLDRNNLYEKVRHLSRSYPYNATIPACIERKIDKNKEDQRKGFLSIKGTILKKNEAFDSESNKEMDPELEKMLYEICDVANDKNVKLIVCISPSLSKFNSLSVNRIAENLKNKDVDFFDFSSDETFKNQKMFYDEHHLNEDGALLFSQRIGKIVKESITRP